MGRWEVHWAHTRPPPPAHAPRARLAASSMARGGLYSPGPGSSSNDTGLDKSLAKRGRRTPKLWSTPALEESESARGRGGVGEGGGGGYRV